VHSSSKSFILKPSAAVFSLKVVTNNKILKRFWADILGHGNENVSSWTNWKQPSLNAVKKQADFSSPKRKLKHSMKLPTNVV
jgi:hypothetical protein